MARRQSLASPADDRLPLYEWAFDDRGRPVTIDQAVRGRTYTCPLCGGKMISRQGEIKQFHYAHEEDAHCPPELVARHAATRWLALRLQECVSHHQAVQITWPCRLCELPHSANLLARVTDIRERHAWRDWTTDLALLDAEGQPSAVITLGPAAPDALRAYAISSITALEIPADSLRGQPFGLAQLLTGATIYGGQCATQQELMRQGIIADCATLRILLAGAALRAPHHAYGLLEARNGVTHVLALNERRLWLPPAMWQRAVGGLQHTIQPALQVITQEWPQEDGAIVALFYVTVHAACAVAVRRFPPGVPVHANLANVPLRVPEVAAIQIARGFACD